jgi:hypothetical protein
LNSCSAMLLHTSIVLTVPPAAPLHHHQQVHLKFLAQIQILIFLEFAYSGGAMEQWKARKRGRTSVPADRKPRPAKSASSDHDLLLNTAQLAVQNAGNIRSISSCLQNVILLPVEHAVAKATLQAGVDYHKERESGEAANDLGKPYLHVWKALILALIQLPCLTANEKTLLENHAKAVESPDQLLGQVFVCRASITHDKVSTKLLVSVANGLDTLMQSVCAALKRDGADIRFGSAPRSMLERQILAQLRSMGEGSQPYMAS